MNWPRIRIGLIACCTALPLQSCGWAPHPMLDSRPGSSPTSWRTIATDADRARLRHWRESWLAGMKSAQASDNAAVKAAGKLLEPDFGLDNPMPPQGQYSCRVYRLGATTSDMPEFEKSAAKPCLVEQDGNRLRFTLTDGRQRPDGVIFPDTNGRAIFLGTLLLSGETTAIDYGRDDNRDVIGIVTRIGDHRWRMAIPDQAFGSKIQVIELTSAS